MKFLRHEAGVVLLTSLIMLIAMTLIALAGIRMSTVNLRTVNNLQLRQEEQSAIQRAIELAISNDFSTTLASGTAASTQTVAISSARSFDVSLNRCLRGISYVTNAEIFSFCSADSFAALPTVDRVGYCGCIEKSDYEAAFSGSAIASGGALLSGVQEVSSTGLPAAVAAAPSRCGRVGFTVTGSATEAFAGTSTRIDQGVELLKSDTTIKQLREKGVYCSM